jgi:hypothetical protein
MARRRHSTRPTKPGKISNCESRNANLSPGRDSQFAIRNSKFCGAGGRIRTFNQLGLSQSPLPIGSRQHNHVSRINVWYRRRDSNPHQLVSKTSASARLGHAGTLQISNCESRISILATRWPFAIRNSQFAFLDRPSFDPRFSAEAAGVEPAQEFTRRLSTPLPYH